MKSRFFLISVAFTAILACAPKFRSTATITSENLSASAVDEAGATPSPTATATPPLPQGFESLVSFDRWTDNCANPLGKVIESGGVLYGTTYSGGPSSMGSIFKVNLDGSGMDSIHEFTVIANGRYPQGGLTMVSGVLYGVTQSGGTSNAGTIYKINTDGSGFAVLHNFDDTNGKFPTGDLIEIAGKLYGVTANGGSNGYGFVFRMDLDGNNYTNIFTFDMPILDGAVPIGGLIHDSGVLYGVTNGGGVNGWGTVYKMNLDGSGHTILKDFSNSAHGMNPGGGLLKIGSAVYGITIQGGSNSGGTIYKVSTDATGFSVLYNINNSTEGMLSSSDLLNVSGTLYGTLRGGNGSVFEVNPDGTGFSIVHSFVDSDGKDPKAGLINVSGTLYGTTNTGGSNGYGTVFHYVP